MPRRPSTKPHVAAATETRRLCCPVTTRLDEDTKRWLEELRATYEISDSDNVRMIIEEARAAKWNPADYLRRRAEKSASGGKRTIAVPPVPKETP